MLNTKLKHFKIDAKYIDENNVWDIIYPIVKDISIYDTEKRYLQDLNRYSTEQINVFVIYLYMNEINNGGHSQFYYNSVGMVFPELSEALKTLHLIDFLKLFEESMRRMQNGLDRNREVRMKFLKEFNPDFEELDMHFFDLSEKVSLEKILKKYILDHKGEFYFDGKLEVIELKEFELP